MLSALSKREWLIVGGVIVGTFAVEYVLPIGQFPSLLLVAFVVLVGAFVLVPGAWETLYRKTGIAAGAWLLAAAVAGTGIALSYLLGDPQPFYDGLHPYRRYLSAYGWASVVFVASSLGVAVAAGHLGRYRRIRNASSVPAAEVEPGLVAVEGRITPAGGTLAGPVSGEEAVWYRRARETSTVFSGHREVEQVAEGSEFYVVDGSGRLLVLPERVDEHAAAQFANSHSADDGDGRRREWSYEPDDPVTVVGRASEVSRAEYPEPVVVGLDGPVIVGRPTVGELRWWAWRRAVLGGAIAVVFGGASFVAMLLLA